MGVRFYPGEQTRDWHREMLRQHTPEICTCTRHDTAPARIEQARTAAIRRDKKEPQATVRGLGVAFGVASNASYLRRAARGVGGGG
jgi:hypothetical protein